LRGAAQPPAPRVLIAPSVMCADMCRLGDEIKMLDAAGADL
jgi:pentose-5-phosphate-3-epimerase